MVVHPYPSSNSRILNDVPPAPPPPNISDEIGHVTMQLTYASKHTPLPNGDNQSDNFMDSIQSCCNDMAPCPTETTSTSTNSKCITQCSITPVVHNIQNSPNNKRLKILHLKKQALTQGIPIHQTI